MLKKFKEFLNENNSIHEIWSEDNQLNSIGTEQQYSDYLDTIFPDSKVKGVFYHKTNAEFEVFDKTKIKDKSTNRFYFTPFEDTVRYGKNRKAVILNIKNLAKPSNKNFIETIKKEHPEYTEGKSQWFDLASNIYMNANKYGFDGVYEYEGTTDDEYSVYNPEQIHILGSKQDIEGFKKFVGKEF